MKLYQNIVFLFCFLFPSPILSIRTIGQNEFPKDLLYMFEAYGEGASQRSLGADVWGRELIEIISSYGNEYIYAIYKDKLGMIWQILKDADTRQEVVFINVMDNDGEIVHYHPDSFKELGLASLVPPNRVIHPPDDIPCSNGFVTDDEIFQKQYSETEDDDLFGQEADIEECEVNEYNSYDKDEGPIKEQPVLVEDNDLILWIVGGSSLCLGLIGLCYLAKNAAICTRYLARVDTWSSWKSEESYDTLLMVAPKYLVKDLIRDINVVYYQEDDPIACFLHDVQQEYETLLSWIQFRNIVDRFYLPLGADFYLMGKRLTLLERMRKAVHYWRAQKIEMENASN